MNESMQEIQLMCKIKPHSNVVQFQGYCKNNGTILVVTELCKRGSLLTFLESNSPMDKKLILNILNGIASGMNHLHKQGIVHRDLAARNILLTASLDVKVSDFGMSKILENSEIDGQKTNSTIGPIRWMAPEFITEKLYSTKSDVWSFGVVIYEVTMRKIPYTEKTNEQVILHVCNSTQLPLDQPVQYPKLATLMQICMDKDPKKRPNFDTICGYLLD